MKRYLPAVLVVLAVIGGALWFMLRPETPASNSSSTTAGVSEVEPDVGAHLARLTVRVVDIDGEPTEGAAVEGGSIAGTTDAAGTFTARVEPGDVELRATKEGYLGEGPLAAEARVHLAPGTGIDISLTLRQSGSISGRVTAGAEPVAARLSLLYAGDEFSVDGAGQSTSDGTFELEAVPPGRVRILVETDANYANTTSREIALVDGENIEGVEIDVAAGGTIAGKVVDDAGEPVKGAEVVALGESTARSRRTETTDTGGFRIAQFPAGNARLRVRAEGFDEAVLEGIAVTPAEVSVVEVTLRQGSGVWGRVSTPDGDAPALAFVLLLGGSDGEEALVRTEPDGSYRLEVEPEPGSRVVAVSPYWETSRETEATPGANIDLHLRPGGRIRGRVVDSRGAAVTDFEIGVESFEVDGAVPYRSRSVATEEFVSSDGSFEFGPLRPGRYWLRASAGGHAPGAVGPLEIRSGATLDGVVIELTSGGDIVGKVTDEEGEPVARASVAEFDPMSPFRTASTRTADDGTFELRGVPPGRRSLRVARKGYLTAVSSGLDVPPGGETERNVVLSRKKPGEKFSFHGIGAVLSLEDGAVNVRETMDEKPASVFGLQAGDQIIGVDGESTRDMRLGNVVELIRGEEGVPVELEIEREGEGRLTVEVERGRVVVK